MKTKYLILSFFTLLLGCDSKNDFNDKTMGQVLLLKIDYLTNTFVGGIEFQFPQRSDDFTIEPEYMPPGDFGYVKLKYKELDKILFDGAIHWMGRGEMKYPQKLLPANKFKIVSTEDFVYPVNGFEDIFNPQEIDLEYDNVWLTAQTLVKAREYLEANPSQKVKLFLYTPSVGAGNPADWDWIIFLKK
ncbi:MAG: hypothetical protein LBS34_02715 [Rickettsiales bacterium]|jgi:hypothetical protein|nr:hypothetical protein [Rickettsiales bacterium]